MNILKKGYNFLFKNTHKWLTIQSYYYSAIFRYKILHVEMEKLHKEWGIKGEESGPDETESNYRYAREVAFVVNQICSKTSWESKCLVRALTAQKLLSKKNIKTTLYLGCALEDSKMVAHAWLRCGKYYVTGGDGKKYSVVSKFLK